jgi:hypothetical protein
VSPRLSFGGEQHPAIRIQVDPAKLASSGLTLEEVRRTLVGTTTIARRATGVFSPWLAVVCLLPPGADMVLAARRKPGAER